MGISVGDKEVHTRKLRSRCLTVEGPEFWGRFECFVDREDKVALILPKMDRSIHVLLGTLDRASVHLIFDGSGTRTSAVNVADGGILWQFTPGDIVFSGTQLPGDQASYRGRVCGSIRFKGRIDPAWVDQRVKARLETMAETPVGESGLNPTLDVQDRLERFAARIRRYEDHVFGIRLLVVACTLQFDEQPEVLRVMRETYEAVIVREEQAISAARILLQRVRHDQDRLADLARFQFPSIRGDVGLDDMTRQAETYVKVYDQLFSVRHKAFSLPRKECLRLVRRARQMLGTASEAAPQEIKSQSKARAAARTGDTLDCHI